MKDILREAYNPMIYAHPSQVKSFDLVAVKQPKNQLLVVPFQQICHWFTVYKNFR